VEALGLFEFAEKIGWMKLPDPLNKFPARICP
jgi:hypothetical protein